MDDYLEWIFTISHSHIIYLVEHANDVGPFNDIKPFDDLPPPLSLLSFPPSMAD